MTLAIALWGAILSSILAYRQLTADWPKLSLENDRTSDEGKRVKLILKNEGKHSLVLHGVKLLVGNARLTPHSKSTSSAVRTAMNEVMHGDLQLIIVPNDEYEFSLETHSDSRLLVFSVHWSSARLSLFPRIPLLVAIRRSQLNAISRTSE
jgi:hypothetical protein